MIDGYTFLKTLIYPLFIYLGIRGDVVEVLYWIMMLDMILGMMKALRLDVFNMKVLIWGFVIKLSILIIPFLVALIAKGLSLDFSKFVNTIIQILIINEGISCFSNIISIKKKEVVKNADYVTMILQVIKKGLSGAVERMIKVSEAMINNKK